MAWQVSYSIYLVHEMFFLWLFPKTSPLLIPHFGNYGGMMANAVLGLVLALVIASSFYVWIERPCMRIRSHPSVLNLIEFFKRPKWEANDSRGRWWTARPTGFKSSKPTDKATA